MTPQDLRIFCTALGFTAVVMGGQGQSGSAEDTRRALGFADLIEAFCAHTIPGLTRESDAGWRDDQSIEILKKDLRDKGIADMQKDRQTLLRLYERLCRRYAAYASDNMVADRVLELLDAEINHGHESQGEDGNAGNA